MYLGIIAALIGLLLRSYFVWPQAFNFRFMLHAHSHAMLLAWLLGALILIIYQQWEIKLSQSTKILFNGLALSVVGMLCSFPFQGYAAISISFSTLHLWLSYALFYRLFRALKNRGPSAKLLRTGILLFYLSSLGPYCLGPLMANEMQSSPWYDQAIYFYLHFLYNGSFFFFLKGILLFFSLHCLLGDFYIKSGRNQDSGSGLIKNFPPAIFWPPSGRCAERARERSPSRLAKTRATS